MILDKLQKVKPKILTANDWQKHCQRLDQMSSYMMSYKNGPRSYSKIRSSATVSGHRSDNDIKNKSFVGGSPSMDSPVKNVIADEEFFAT